MPNTETPVEMARRHVKEGTQHVDNQSALMGGMDQDSENFSLASELLATMKATLVIFKGDLERLEAQA